MNLDEVLERLTARINPRRFRLGVETSRIRAELAEGHAENSIKTGISVLADQCHIDVYPGRYKVGKRRLIRTMDDRLVLAGARGPSLIERLVQHGFTCEAMQLRDVSEIAIDSHTVDFTEVADVLKVVFRLCDDS